VRRLGITGVILVLAVLLPTGAGASTPVKARWTIEPTPDPAGAINSSFSSIACVTESDCMAVGFYNDTSGERTFAEHWDGSGWSMEKTRDLPNAFGNSLDGVACPRRGPGLGHQPGNARGAKDWCPRGESNTRHTV
jgi:hypothetical protein